MKESLNVAGLPKTWAVPAFKGWRQYGTGFRWHASEPAGAVIVGNITVARGVHSLMKTAAFDRGGLLVVAFASTVWALAFSATAAGLDDCTQTGDMNRVIAGCTKVTEESWATPAQLAMALNNRGNAHEALDHLDEAERDYDRAIALNPHYASAYYNRAILHARRERFDRALSDLNVVLTLEERRGWAYHMRGYVYEKLGQYDLAVADFTAALEFDRGSVQSLNNRGVALRKKQEFQRALADFDAALALQPNYLLARSNRARTLTDLGEVDKAIAELATVVGLRPAFVEAYLARATAYERIDRIADALADYRRALELAPSNPSIVGHIVRLQANTESVGGAKRN